MRKGHLTLSLIRGWPRLVDRDKRDKTREGHKGRRKALQLTTTHSSIQKRPAFIKRRLPKRPETL